MTTENMDKLAELKKLMAQFSADELKNALKSVKSDKSTMLSVTADAIVAAELTGSMITDNVVKDVTKRAIEAQLIKADETATAGSVAQIMRHIQAHDAAMTRAGYHWQKIPVEEPVDGEEISDTPVDPVAVPGSDSNNAQGRRRAA